MLHATTTRTMRPLSRRALLHTAARIPSSPFATRAPAAAQSLTRPSTYSPAAATPRRTYSATPSPASTTPASPSASNTNTQLDPPSHLNPAERDIYDCLSAALQPSALEVQDVSGGCGSMYALNVTSESFRGLSVMKQHRMVNAALGGRVKEWHGVQVRTSVPV